MKLTYLLPLCLLYFLTTAQAQTTRSDYSLATNTTNALASANTSYWQAISDGLESAAAPVSTKTVETGWVLARPRSNKAIGTGSSASSLGGQVSAQMSYPEVLRRGNHRGIVVVTFGIAYDNSLWRLQVHTENRELNEEIARQLAGCRIRLADSTPMETYTVRLRFVP